MAIFGVLFTIVFYAGLFVLIRTVVQKSREMSGPAKVPMGQPLKNPVGSKRSVTVQRSSEEDLDEQLKKISKLRDSAVMMRMEDRQNDWLARQLREEEKTRKRSALDLGGVHDVHADSMHRKVTTKK